MNAWLGWAPTAPDELDANLRLSTSGDPDRSPVVNLSGAMLGTESDTTPLLSGFVDLVGADPSTEFQRSMPHRDVKRHLSGLGATETEPDQPEQRSMFSKSEFFQRPLPQQAITAVLDHLAEGLGAGQSRDLRFTPWGGAYNRVRSDATAFVHRDEMVMVEHVVTVEPTASSVELAAARGWLDRSWASVHPWGSRRVYPNFPDPDLQDWADAYYGTNYDRLLRAKGMYDPANWFRFPQSLLSPSRHRISGTPRHTPERARAGHRR